MGKRTLNTPLAPAPIGSYSQATAFGNFLFLSGQIAIDPSSGQFLEGDIRSQAKQIMQNLGAILDLEGIGWNEVVKTTIFLTDMGEFPLVNEVYGGFFTGDYPARETVGVASLPKGAKVEISMIACKK